MNKFILTTTLCVLVLVIICDAQADYQAGYVVNLKGDTIKGLIEYKRWDRSPRNVQFKNSTASSVSEYHPKQITSFSVADEIYESAMVDVELSPYKLRDLDQSPLPNYVRDTVFLQSLVSGQKSLLFLKDQSGKNQFYAKEEDAYIHLLYKEYAGKTETSSKVVVENNGYKGRLALYLKDCPRIQEQLKATKYNSSSLTRLFEYYYTCTNASLSHKKDRQEGWFEAGLVAGASLTQVNFKGELKYLTNVEFSSSVDPTFGLFYDLKLLRTKGWRISNELLFASFDIKGEGYFEDFPDYTASSTFSYSFLKSYHALQVGLLAKGKIYMAAGLTAGLVIKDDAEIKISYETGSTVFREFKSKDLEFGYLAGIGFRGARWSGEFRFEQTTGISNHLSESSKLARGYFLVRCRIFNP